MQFPNIVHTNPLHYWLIYHAVEAQYISIGPDWLTDISSKTTWQDT